MNRPDWLESVLQARAGPAWAELSSVHSRNRARGKRALFGNWRASRPRDRGSNYIGAGRPGAGYRRGVPAVAVSRDMLRSGPWSQELSVPVKRIGIVMVGLGPGSQPHLKSLRDLSERVDLRWAVCRRPDNADRSFLPPAVEVTADLSRALSDPEVDMAIAATPPAT